MNTYAIIQLVIGALPSLIGGAEALFGAKKGADKKAAVLSATDAVLGVVGGLGKNDAANPVKRDAIKQIAGAGVDVIVQAMNALDAWRAQSSGSASGGA